MIRNPHNSVGFLNFFVGAQQCCALFAEICA